MSACNNNINNNNNLSLKRKKSFKNDKKSTHEKPTRKDSWLFLRHRCIFPNTLARAKKLQDFFFN